jgi:hypothetical protein
MDQKYDCSDRDNTSFYWFHVSSLYLWAVLELTIFLRFLFIMISYKKQYKEKNVEGILVALYFYPTTQ